MSQLEELLRRAAGRGPVTVALAAAADRETLELVKLARDAGLADFWLTGEREQILAIAAAIGLELCPERVIDAAGPLASAKAAVKLVRQGRAAMLMKGLLPTGTFLGAVLDKETGLRGSGLLSQVSVFDRIVGEGLQLLTDCAINIAPGLEEKVRIIANSVGIAQKLGYARPRVALLAAVETVSPKMPETTEAAILSKMTERGQISGAVVDGPLALDNILSPAAARHKGIDSQVAGQADIIVAPNLGVGNVLHKALVYIGQREVAAVVAGAEVPIIMNSRTDSVRSKLLSIALAVCLAG